MTDAPLLSAAIIVAGEPYLVAIASVFARTYPHRELLLIDDGSRDGSTGRARRCAAEHPDRVCHLEHPGTPTAA